ncbi:taste receptor type 1 member 3 isoform X2 [Pipistrellus kuhlii]|uniref:taste receptor type 1 member 3 isoform X2 n=1 Tax=Pipistrellus kuhlii TaxID=59472 RepID=UPI001E26EC56|nr:taste receptor type 1 member 3 isoform X2 [Pipistrellus kuhlii]
MAGLALLGLWALLGLGAGGPLCLSRQLRMRGDYVLGGLFPLGAAEDAGEDAGLGPRTQPNTTVCTRFSSLGLLWALAMMMAVEEINRGSALLPGLRLGHDIFDTCSEPVVAMKPSLGFMAEAGGRDVAAYCDYSRYQPRVLAVIGPHSTELALVTGKLFGFFLMPQVSYGASADRLSDREAFPSFFRTVPSDRAQVAAVVELLHALQWNWVAAVGSDDEYGRQGLSLFSSLASARGLCIAHEGLLRAATGGAHGPQLGEAQGLLRQVNQSRVQVVVLFSSARAARALFSFSIRSGLAPKVWVASEAWLTSAPVLSLPGLARVGTVLGFLQRGAPMPDFPAYVHARLARAADPAFCASLGAGRPGPEGHVAGPGCPQCDHVSPEDVSTGLLHHQAFSAYAAVYSVAQALHNTLLCTASGCPPRAPVRPWQLLENMYNMSFRVRGLPLGFDASGNVDMAYDLKLWVWRDPEPELRTVGSFDGRLQLQLPQMRWHTPGNTVSAGPGPTAQPLSGKARPPGGGGGGGEGEGAAVPGPGGAPGLRARPESEAPLQRPVSQCSRKCQEGQVRRVKGFHSCCYDCMDCKAGSYRRSPDDLSCTPCGQDQWSPDRSLRCFARRPRWLAWGEPAVLVLLALLALTLGLVLAALGLFVRHRDSPLVQASGGPRACFGLACLGLACLSVLLLPGRPRPARCLAQQPLLHLPLTGCLSALLLRAAEVFVEAELPPGWAHRLRGHLRGRRAWLAVLLAMLAEAALCTWYLVAFPPEVVTDWQVLPREALVHCRVRSWVGFALVHAGNAVLASLCFLGTFLVHRQPGRGEGARSLTFAMLAYFITWVSFVPLFANVHVAYQPAVQMGASLLCVLGILATFHLPRCCLLLRQPAGTLPASSQGGGPGGAGGPGGSRGGALDPATSPQGAQT